MNKVLESIEQLAALLLNLFIIKWSNRVFYRIISGTKNLKNAWSFNRIHVDTFFLNVTQLLFSLFFFNKFPSVVCWLINICSHFLGMQYIFSVKIQTYTFTTQYCHKGCLTSSLFSLFFFSIFLPLALLLLLQIIVYCKFDFFPII